MKILFDAQTVSSRKIPMRSPKLLSMNRSFPSLFCTNLVQFGRKIFIFKAFQIFFVLKAFQCSQHNGLHITQDDLGNILKSEIEIEA